MGTSLRLPQASTAYCRLPYGVSYQSPVIGNWSADQVCQSSRGMRTVGLFALTYFNFSDLIALEIQASVLFVRNYVWLWAAYLHNGPLLTDKVSKCFGR